MLQDCVWVVDPLVAVLSPSCASKGRLVTQVCVSGGEGGVGLEVKPSESLVVRTAVWGCCVKELGCDGNTNTLMS